MKLIDEQKNTKVFVKKWLNKGNEKQDTSKFWIDLLTLVFGVKNATNYLDFEKPVTIIGEDNKSCQKYIDVYIPNTKVLIEQKGQNISLSKKETQSDGAKLTPFEQGLRYNQNLAHNENARWIIACNFQTFEIHDMNHPQKQPVIIPLNELPTEIYKLDFLIDKETKNIEEKTDLSIKAGDLVAKIYDEILKQYGNDVTEQDYQNINQLCVRLVFCLYAEDAGLFGKKNQFSNYLNSFTLVQMNGALSRLFQTLDTPEENRPKFLESDLQVFPYFNGGLFKDEVEIPPFTQKLKELLLNKASQGFNWKNISPTIFGAVFESTLNPETRREEGMHYTSVQNIHRVIDPLFLDDLKKELQSIKEEKKLGERKTRAKNFQTKLSQLNFFDPACGSGNFLTETYLSLRKLENEAIIIQREDKNGNIQGEFTFDSKDLIQITIQQMYGIEINDFAVSVAKTALWIAEAQMYEETINATGLQNGSVTNFLPLDTYENIHKGNALRLDWNKVIPSYKLTYIMGNPPFKGLSSLPAKDKALKKEQTEDMDLVFGKLPKHGKLDYVSAWYEKAANMMQGTNIKTAFVSTNSITQGEQVGILWKHLFEDKNVTITFAYRSFVWNSEATMKAHVHCVIIGFTCTNYSGDVLLFEDEVANKKVVSYLNGYLTDFDNIYIQSRKSKPPFNMPEMHKGSQPTDGGGLILTPKEKDKFLSKYPNDSDLVDLYLGSNELIKGKKRYCLWLKDISPARFSKNKFILDRLNTVIEARKNSSTDAVRNNAEVTPYLFTQIRQPETDYIAVPEVSSENRKYIPIAFLSKNVIASNKLYLIPSDQLWIFSVLISELHMTWVRTVAGRLETRYSYSPAVYTNFPWKQFSNKEKEQLIDSAKNILNARDLYNDASLADLYNPKSMPIELIKAHQKNDDIVAKIYGLSSSLSESEIIRKLFLFYEKLNKEVRKSKKK